MSGVWGKLGDSEKKVWSRSRNKQFFYPSLLRGAECTSQLGRRWKFLQDMVLAVPSHSLGFTKNTLPGVDQDLCLVPLSVWGTQISPLTNFSRLPRVRPYRVLQALLKCWHCLEGNERLTGLERVCTKGSGCSRVVKRLCWEVLVGEHLAFGLHCHSCRHMHGVRQVLTLWLVSRGDATQESSRWVFTLGSRHLTWRSIPSAIFCLLSARFVGW